MSISYLKIHLLKSSTAQNYNSTKLPAIFLMISFRLLKNGMSIKQIEKRQEVSTGLSLPTIMSSLSARLPIITSLEDTAPSTSHLQDNLHQLKRQEKPQLLSSILIHYKWASSKWKNRKKNLWLMISNF